MEAWPPEWDDDGSPTGSALGWDDDDLSVLDFEDRYPPDVLAAIESRSPESGSEPISRLSRWSRSSAIGAVLTGAALGLQQVFDPEEERKIVIEVDDDGLPLDLPVELFLDPDSPQGSLCIVHRSNVPPPLV